MKRIWRAPGNHGRRVRVLLRSMAWMINKKTLRKPWMIPVYGGLRLRCYPNSIIALHVIQRGEFHDWDTAKFITEFLREGDIFVDVGANIGLYTLPAAAKKVRVVAVEPSARNLDRLRENLSLNGFTNVKMEASALGSTDGEMAFRDDDALAHIETNGNGSKVPVRRLDSILPDGQISLLKVDVEGFELAVFQGAENAMCAGRLPVILFEMNRAYERYDFTEVQIFGFLRERGYQIARYEHDTRRLVTHGLEGDVVAFTPLGGQLLRERLFV
ncbi:MAG: FkbM family methyltransferase [Prosthecobacter sp.]